MKPVTFTWDGDAMVPQARFRALCDRQFVVGEDYPLVVQEQRSQATHNHFFASVHEGWQNLPEDLAAQFPTAEHLRKYALVKAGYADERSIVCGSKAEAQRVAAFVKPLDEYAVVLVREATVKVFTPQSQSMRAMGREAFRDSKEAVLAVIADMIGIAPGELRREAGRAA